MTPDQVKTYMQQQQQPLYDQPMHNVQYKQYNASTSTDQAQRHKKQRTTATPLQQVNIGSDAATQQQQQVVLHTYVLK